MKTRTAPTTAGPRPRARRPHIPLAQTACALALAAPLAAWAQSQDDAGAARSAADEASIATLGTVTVTGGASSPTTEGMASYTTAQTAASTRLPLSLRQTPQSVTVMTRQRIEDQQLNDITQVVGQSPGISIQPQDSERVHFYARGFRVDDILYDGVPSYASDQYSSNGKKQSDMAIYDRVEIVRGASGLMTGTGNPGASLNLVRKMPTSAFQASAALSAGSWDRHRAEADLSGPLNAAGTVRGRIVGAYSDGNSFMDFYAKRRTVGYGVIQADLTPSTVLTLGMDTQTNKATGVTWGGLPPFWSDGTRTHFSRAYSTATRWSWWDEDTRNVFVTLDRAFGNGWEIKASFNHYRSGFASELSAWGGWAVRGVYPDKATGGNAFQFPGKFDEADRTNAVDVYASGPFQWGGRTHELVVGIGASRQTHDGRAWYPLAYPALSSSIYTWDHDDPMPPMRDPEHYTGKNVDLGAYGAARLHPTDRLAVILGARVASYRRQQDNTNPAPTQYTRYDNRENGVITPYAGLVYDMGAHHSAYASYTRIYHPQNDVDEQGSVLPPARGNAYETGVKGEYFGGALNASAALFRIDQDNLAQAAGTHGTSTFYRAAPGVRSKGIELEINGQIRPGWNIGAGYTHQIAQDSAGTRVNPDIPRSVFRLFTTYKLPGAFNRLTVGGGVDWNSSTYSDLARPAAGVLAGEGATVRFRQGSYAVANLMARYDISRNLSANLAVSNVFDRKYYLGTSFYSNVIYGEPRNAMMTLRWRM